MAHSTIAFRPIPNNALARHSRSEKDKVMGNNKGVASHEIDLGKIPGVLVIIPLLLVAMACGSGGSSNAPKHVPAQVIATVQVGVYPIDIAVNSATNRIYVANRGHGVDPGSVMVIEGSTNSVIGTVTAGFGPCAIAVNSITNKIYLTNSDDASVTVIDGATNTTQTINLGVGNFPCGLAVDAATNKIYVANYDRATVTVIDGATNNTTTIPVAALPGHIAINSATNQIYVCNSASDSADTTGSLTIIDGETNKTSAIPLNSALGDATFRSAVNPTTNKVYVSGGNIVTIVDVATLTSSTIPAGSDVGVIALNANTNKVYVADNKPTSSPNFVAVIDGATLDTLTVPTGQYPGVIALDEATNQIYVLNRDSGTVTVIDGASNSTDTLGVGMSPSGAALNPVTHRVYVINACGNDSACSTNGTLSVIDGAH